VINELADWMKTGGGADFITLSGSGEPTLHSRFGEVIGFIRANSSVPVALLTNGTLLSLPEVREAASLADVVKISLSAWDQASYGWVNRPHPRLRFEKLVEGEKALRRCFSGEIWLEVFLVAGMNSLPDDVSRIAALAAEIRPDRIHLNTAVRPPAEEFAVHLSRERLSSLCGLFSPPAQIMAEFTTEKEPSLQANEETIFSMLQRRPCTADDIARAFGMHRNEVSKYLGILSRSGRVVEERKGGTVYYREARAETGINRLEMS
jgi:wyosine [tRNA(Phe)-imidazoG37] synthetase (radical SAM superfamily)